QPKNLQLLIMTNKTFQEANNYNESDSNLSKIITECKNFPTCCLCLRLPCRKDQERKMQKKYYFHNFWLVFCIEGCHKNLLDLCRNSPSCKRPCAITCPIDEFDSAVSRAIFLTLNSSHNTACIGARTAASCDATPDNKEGDDDSACASPVDDNHVLSNGRAREDSEDFKKRLRKELVNRDGHR
ncbi:hypothetical protein L9F63_001575, partial [Diploptera punctata]